MRERSEPLSSPQAQDAATAEAFEQGGHGGDPVWKIESPPAPRVTEVTRIPERDFQLIRSLVYREAGICLGPAKKALVVARLQRRMRELSLSSFRQYYRRATEDRAETVLLLDAITTNETRFFREVSQFQFLEHVAAPRWRLEASQGLRSKVLRVWSAGCSSGEEPYSVAMTLLTEFPPSSGWAIEIFATDLSTRVLDRARKSVWPLKRSEEIPHPYLKAFMLRGVGEKSGTMKAGPELRALVRFSRLNLNEPPYSAPRDLDLILCRNVLIYFDAESRRKTVSSLVNHLSGDGYYFVGHAESMNGVTDRLEAVAPMIYRPVGPAASRG